MMKKNIILIVTILGFYACKAQQPVLNIYGSEHKTIDFDNAYFKDTENFRDQFVGSWVYTNGNTLLKVVFQKRDMIQLSNYMDFLVGEFQYIENGVEKMNTLNNLNNNYTGNDIFKYNLLSGVKLINTRFPVCEDCPEGAERLSMRFDEPLNDDDGLSADFVIMHVVENGVEKLKVQFVKTSSAFNTSKYNRELPSVARNFTIPYGNYTLIKVD